MLKSTEEGGEKKLERVTAQSSGKSGKEGKNERVTANERLRK